jgi:hypothetical protein
MLADGDRPLLINRKGIVVEHVFSDAIAPTAIRYEP